MKRVFTALLSALVFIYPLARAQDEEFFLADIPLQPAVTITAPATASTYAPGGDLVISARGDNTDTLEAYLSWTDAAGEAHELRYSTEELSLAHTFTPGDMTAEALLRVVGTVTDKHGTRSAEATRRILSPKAYMIDRMIELAQKNSTMKQYRFAPAETDTDIGVCKNFVMRLFDTFKADYRMLAYPTLAMHMPKNNSKVACAPYDYGIEWRPETAEDGSPFEIVYQFKYNNDLSKEENAQLAREMMHMVQKGDFFQMVGYYGGGNGPHSLFFIADYNPANDTLRWTDSNMRGTRVDGVRWGYMQFDADATAEWYVEVFNMKKRGATLYRLRDDLYMPKK